MSNWNCWYPWDGPPSYIRCIWGWLLRSPHYKGTTIFPMIFAVTKMWLFKWKSTQNDMPTCRKVSKWWIYSIINQLSTIYRNKTKTKQETLQHTKAQLARKHSEKMCKKKLVVTDFWWSQLLMISRLLNDPSLIPVNMSLVGGEVGFGVVVTGTWASPQLGGPPDPGQLGI